MQGFRGYGQEFIVCFMYDLKFLENYKRYNYIDLIEFYF